MINYAICEINGNQVMVTPNKPLEVDFLGGIKEIEAKVLFLSDEKGIKVGKPYLNDKIKLNFLENIKGQKIRVSKFHAKANYRRVSGIRPKKTKLVLLVKK